MWKQTFTITIFRLIALIFSSINNLALFEIVFDLVANESVKLQIFETKLSFENKTIADIYLMRYTWEIVDIYIHKNGHCGVCFYVIFRKLVNISSTVFIGQHQRVRRRGEKEIFKSIFNKRFRRSYLIKQLKSLHVKSRTFIRIKAYKSV